MHNGSPLINKDLSLYDDTKSIDTRTAPGRRASISQVLRMVETTVCSLYLPLIPTPGTCPHQEPRRHEHFAEVVRRQQPQPHPGGPSVFLPQPCLIVQLNCMCMMNPLTLLDLHRPFRLSGCRHFQRDCLWPPQVRFFVCWRSLIVFSITT